MNAREILTLAVVLGCGLAVGYAIGLDNGRADAAATPAPQAAASAASPASAAAPADTPAPVQAPPAEPETVTVAVKPVVSPHQPAPVGGGALAPVEVPSEELDGLSAAVRERLPNTPFSLHGTAFRGDPAKAAVTLTVFSDFECQYCARLIPTLETIEKTYGEKVVVAFRHHILPFHENAIHAHRAAIAAHQQGRFWDFHDAIFAEQSQLTEDAMTRIAARLELDMDKFTKALGSQEVDIVLGVDRAVGEGVGVQGTPTLLLNGRKLMGALPFQTLKPLLESEIARVEAKSKAENLAIFQARSQVSEVNFKRTRGEAGSLNALHNITTEGVTLKGAEDPLVVVMIFSDFECPFCSRLSPIIERALKEYPDKVAVGFRHYPLDIHPHARLAGQATEFAERFGKFWEMHDRLFANQESLGLDDLVKHGEAIGLDGPMLRRALTDQTHKQDVENDLQLGNLIGVAGTPTVAINGRLLEGVKEWTEYQTLIDEALDQAQSLISEKQAKREGYYKKLMEMVPPN